MAGHAFGRVLPAFALGTPDPPRPAPRDYIIPTKRESRASRQGYACRAECDGEHDGRASRALCRRQWSLYGANGQARSGSTWPSASVDAVA